MERRIPSGWACGLGLLVLLAAMLPIAHLGDDHHTSDCVACHFAQHAGFALETEAVLLAPSGEATLSAVGSDESGPHRPASPRAARAPPSSSR